MDPMNPGGPAGGQPQQGYPQPGYPQPGYPQPGYPQQGVPNVMAGMGGIPGMGNRYGAAQSSLKNAGGMLKAMQYGFTGLGALFAFGGVASIFFVGFSMGISLIVTGVVLVAVAWTTLPKFMGQLGGATEMVNALAAKDQLAMTGIPTTAKVLGMQQTGTMINMNPQVQAMLEVQGPQGPYQVQTLAVIPQMNIPQFQPGSVVNVRVNPQNHQDVAVVF